MFFIEASSNISLLAPDQQQMFSRIVQHLSGPPLPTGDPNPGIAKVSMRCKLFI